MHHKACIYIWLNITSRKILIFYIGFGTPSANLLKPVLMKMKHFSFEKNMDDFTLWRYNIINRNNTGDIWMKSEPFGSNGWVCIYELESAYISSALCDKPTNIKLSRQLVCNDAIAIQFMNTITKLTIFRHIPIFGTPTACIIQRKLRDYNNYLDEFYGID